MSTTVVVLELAGIVVFATGVVFAGSPPENLHAWWARQQWLQELLAPTFREPSEKGLTILPWSGTMRSIDSRRAR